VPAFDNALPSDCPGTPTNQSILCLWNSATDGIVFSSTPMTVNGYPALYIVGQEPPPPGSEDDQVGPPIYWS